METIQTEENFREHQLYLGQYQEVSDMSNWLPKREEKGRGKMFEEIMTANILNLIKTINPHFQEAQ